MSSDNKIAKTVGVLFVVTMLLGMLDAYAVAPLLDLPLQDYSQNRIRFHIGAFLILCMCLGVVGIAASLYPILEKHNKIIALFYLCSRLIEVLLLIVGAVVYFVVLKLSESYSPVDISDAPYSQILADLAVATRYDAFQFAMIVVGVASVMLCYLFYKTRLIPRTISVVGIVGYASVFISAPLHLLEIVDTTGAGGLFYVPGTVFELILLPYWLIFRGFNLSYNAHGTN